MRLPDETAAWLSGDASDTTESGLTRATAWMNTRRTSTRLSTKDAAWLLDKLATMLAAGLPLVRALRMIATMRSDLAGRKCADLAQLISAGSTFSDALTAQSRDWGPQVVAMVSAGEAGGDLPGQLRRAAGLLQARVRLRRRLLRAAAYPAFIVILTTALITAILAWVVPQFESLYASFDGELPVLTQVVVALSHSVPQVIAGLIVLIISGRLLWKRSSALPHVALARDAFFLRLPVLGKMYRLGVEARIAATLAGMLSSGVGVLDACQHAAQAAGSPTYANALMRVRERVADGSSFSAALAETKVFPETMIQLSLVGEETASLPELMGKYAEAAEEDLDNATSALTSLIEPILTLVVGLIVAVFVIALYLPLINLSELVSG